MGDVSVMARRLEGGKFVQYGWSGNGGYYKSVGLRLLTWYDDPEKVDYLFGLGQMRLIGKPGSEKGGEPLLYTNKPEYEPHWLGKTEREIFSKIMFIDYGYFYDLDHTWYYIMPGPFRIKIPLYYIHQHLDDEYYEFQECNRIKRKLAEYILGDYYTGDDQMQRIVSEEYPQGIEKIREDVLSEGEHYDEDPCYRLWDRYKAIFNCLDDWVLVTVSDDMEAITGFKVRKRQEENRIETIHW